MNERKNIHVYNHFVNTFLTDEFVKNCKQLICKRFVKNSGTLINVSEIFV